jgi:outer membrane receptor protein involved in Fe transport
MALLELRMDANQLLNVMSAEDLSRFAASDVGDALKRVAGVNVVGGQFAVIRGLDDRYSSTLFNGAPVPSPDPDRQSVQLDLFPSDIVQNLVVSKTFGPDLPGNSAGGSIDIVTIAFPEQIELKLSGGTGGNPYAFDRFIRLNDESPIGHETDGWDALESDFGGSIGGPFEFLGRQFRFKGLINREVDFDTAEGTREAREPRRALRLPNGTVTQTGDLSLGELSLSGGQFDLTESERSEQRTAFGSLGFDLDTEGNHKIDFTAFYTRKDDETVEFRENGFFPNVDYDALLGFERSGQGYNRQVLNSQITNDAWIDNARETRDDAPERGPLWYSSFFESRSFASERDLQIYQLNGDHTIAQIEGLKVSWATNYARTTQDQFARGLRYSFEPDDLELLPTTFPVHVSSLGEGVYGAHSGFTYSESEVEEKQRFGRLDASYEVPFEVPLLDEVVVTFNAGGWYEKADRDVTAAFLDGNPRVLGGLTYVSIETPEELGENTFQNLILDEFGRPQFTRDSETEASRTIQAWDTGMKATFWDRFDLLGGIRREKIEIESNNDPFTGSNTFTGAPGIFPSAYLFFDRLDNPTVGEGNPPPGVLYNDQILGIDVPVDPVTGFVDFRDQASLEAVLNGLIDEIKYLPSVGFAYRPIEGLNLRGAYSKTVARPSFRELGYYATVEPGEDDITVGNPQLQLSDVESFDLRAEYAWGKFGDLVAVSVFAKSIEQPIESIALRDPTNAEQGQGIFRTFFNNPNEASLRGIEAEARKNLGFLGHEFLEHFSIGGNFTYIDAEVERSEAELGRAALLFGTRAGVPAKVQRYQKKRRLYNQPEWIANADVSFDHPGWGTKITISAFAISSTLDAAGSVGVDRLGTPLTFTLDRYVDGFYQLDVVASQHIWRGLVLKLSAKNLTNSTREIIYDEEQTVDQVSERTLKVGRDFSISLSYTHEF